MSTRPEPRPAPTEWARMGVRWFQHERFVSLTSAGASSLFWAMVAWAKGELSDGYVPAGIVPILALAVRADAKADLADLLRVGLLTERDNGFDIHGFLHWQDSAAEVATRRETWREAGRVAGIRSGEVRRAKRTNAERFVTQSLTESRTIEELDKDLRLKTLDKDLETKGLETKDEEGLTSEQRADLNFLATTLDLAHRWTTEQVHAKLAELGPDGLLRALADAHLEQEGVLCSHFGDGSRGQVVVKRLLYGAARIGR